jgi:hypothetical protein
MLKAKMGMKVRTKRSAVLRSMQAKVDLCLSFVNAAINTSRLRDQLGNAAVLLLEWETTVAAAAAAWSSVRGKPRQSQWGMKPSAPFGNGSDRIFACLSVCHGVEGDLRPFTTYNAVKSKATSHCCYGQLLMGSEVINTIGFSLCSGRHVESGLTAADI